MISVPGGKIDKREITKKLRWAAELFDVREMAFDPWGGAGDIATDLIDDDGWICANIRQGYASISQPTKKFLELYTAGQLQHGNNPVLNWNASCLALVSDGNDNVKPEKPERDKASKRIDGVAAIVTALARAEIAITDESCPLLVI
jgi:phage terminase large subunit-like protein